MPRPIQIALLAGVALACMGVAALLKQGLTNQEEIMAKFDGLDADINDLRTEVGACAARVEAAIGPLMDDTADQSEVDAARAEVRAAVDALKAIAPAPEPAPEPAPTEPPTF